MEILLTTLVMLMLAAASGLAGFIVFDRSDRMRVLRDIDDKKDELLKLIAAVQESHNSLTESDRVIDQKVTELGLRLSQLGAPQAKKPGFPGF